MVTRKAVLICSPGNGKGYLPGTALDIGNFKNYLVSPRGGAWREEEFVVFEDPLLASAYQEVIMSAVDYLLVYFCGHGMTVGEKRVLQFCDGRAVDDWFIAGGSPRQLMIVDACREYWGVISGITGAEEEFSSFTGESETRKLFDDYILRSPPGKMIVHAAGKGQKASETNNLGGIFTYYLLENATYMRTVTAYTPVGILQLLGNVRRNLSEDNHMQVPVLAYEEGALNVPFMISVPQIITGGIEQRKDQPRRSKQRMKLRTQLVTGERNVPVPLQKNQRVLLGVLIAAGIYQLLKNAS